MAERDVYLQGLLADSVLGQERLEQSNEALVEDSRGPVGYDSYDVPAQSSYTAGLRQGANSFSSNLEYFKALGNTLIGNEEGAAANVAAARNRQRQAGNAVQGFETFEEFTDAPTFGGFIDQVGMGLGQVTPYAAETIATGLLGYATGGLGFGAVAAKEAVKSGLSEGSEQVARRLVTDLVQKKSRGEVLDEAEEQAAEAIWGAFKKGSKRGATVGVTGGTYPLNTGESFGEFDDAGVDLTADRALQSLLVGAASTAVEVGSEAFLFGKLAGLAKSKAGPDPDGILNVFAKNIGKGAGVSSLTEGATEAAQEGLLVGQRLAVDENYSIDDAQMRLGQAAFLGAIAGTAMGGAGGALATTPEAVSRVFDKAQNLTRQGRKQQLDEEMRADQYGSLNSIYTTPESNADLTAQFDAMQDGEYGKQAVWVAGENTTLGPDAPTQGRVKRNGENVYYAFIEGRGTIFSSDANVVNEVITSNASDPSLAKALGYSSSKSVMDNPDVVVQAKNADGAVISEELTTNEGMLEAIKAAEAIAGAKGSTTVTSVEKAQGERAQRYNAEQSRQMVVDPEDLTETNPEEASPEAQDLSEVDAEGIDLERTKPYAPRPSPDATYDGTDAARSRYNATFGTDVNWASSPLGLASDAALNKASEIQERNPQTSVGLVQGSDGNFNIEANQLDGSLYTFQDKNGNSRRLPLGEFIVESIQKMTQRSKFNQKRKGVPFVTLKNSEGKSKGINIADLINTGKRINQAEAGATFDSSQADTDGLSTIIGALAEQGYTLEVDGAPLQGDSAASVPESYKAVSVNKSKSLFDVMTRKPTPQAKPLSAGQTKQLERESERIDGLIGRALSNFINDKNPTKAEYQAYEARLQERKAEMLRDMEINFGFAREDMVDTASSASGRDRNVPSTPQDEFGEGGGRPTEAFNQGFKFGTNSDGETIPLGLAVNRIPDNSPAPEGELDLAQLAQQEGVNADRFLEMGDNNPGVSTRAPKPEIDADATRVSADEWLSENKQAEVIGTLPQTAKSVLNTMLKKMRLKGKVVVITLSELNKSRVIPNDMSPFSGRYKFGDRVVDLSSNPVLSRELNRVSSSGAAGTHIQMPQKGGGTAHLIIIDDIQLKNEAELTLTLAHEIGHAFYAETVLINIANNEQLLRRLYRDFQNALEKDPDLYSMYEGEDLQFEEWVADQTAKWGASELKARGIVDRFFQALAKKLRTMWTFMRDTFKRRFGQEYSQTFDEFVKDVIRKKDRDNVSAVPDTSQSALDNVAGDPFSPVKQMRVNNIRNAVRKAAILGIGTKGIDALESADFGDHVGKAFGEFLKLVLPAQSRLRLLGRRTGAGQKIANMMYGRSGEQGLGFVQQTTLKTNELQNRLENLFGGNLDYLESKGFQDAVKEAATSKPTAELSEDGQIIRRFLEEIHDDYIAKEPNTDIKKQADYFPVMLDLDLVSDNIDAFAEMVARERGTMTASQVKKRMTDVINNANAELDTPNKSLESGIDPLHSAEEAIELTKGIDREKLIEFSKAPDQALVQYMRRIVKRVEWNRATKGGETTLASELAKLNSKDYESAERTLGALLGFYVPMSSRAQVASAIGQNIQIWSTLSLATLSSLPELATAIIATREFSGVITGFREIINTIANPRERYEFAREIGVVANDSMANAFMSESDLQYMDDTNRKFADKFFKYTGLEMFTRFTRVFAAGMAEKFIVSHAMNPRNRSERYLADLGLDADIVQQWVKDGKGFDTPAGQLVKQGLQKFVESTMLRPNAAERPVWASDPRYALLWQLKSFPYSYGQVVIGGVLREMKARVEEGRAAGKGAGQIIAQDMAPHMALFGLTVLPFAMLALELKERTKYAMGAILPFAEADARVFKTDNMDWSQYFLAAYGAAGVFGPLALLTSAQTDIRWGKPPVSVFGPTVDTLYQVLIKGDYQRALPLYNQFG